VSTPAVMIRTISTDARELAQASPDSPALSDDTRQLSYAALLADAEALAAGLQQIGLAKGDVVSFQLPNWIEAGVVNLAANLLGLLCNPIVPIYRDGELRTILHEARTKCLFIPALWNGFDYAGMASRLQAVLPDLRSIVLVKAAQPGALDYEALIATGRGMAFKDADLQPGDRKLLLFTSGTTGRAKGVLHSQESLTAPLLRAAKAWQLGKGAGVLMPSPVTHVTGYCCGLEMPLFLGTSTVLMERWKAARAVEIIDAQQSEATVGATPFLSELLDAAEATGSRLRSLRIFACGGASVPPALVRRANTRLAGGAFRVYGLSEAPLVTFGSTARDTIDVAADTDGRLNGYDVRIVGPAGDTDQHDGEILVRGAGLFLGYHDPRDNVDAFDADGYFRTGDLGRLRGDCLVITGRKKDLIIRGGENISAKEIEDALAGDARILETAAVSMPHARLGEAVCLFAVLAPGFSLFLDDIVSILSDAGLARQKFPERLVLVDCLPKTPSGKTRKDLLRQMTWRTEDAAREPA
jgi:acyl-CoA synthetase (AMP-forming)/AMP-acid ligase II